MKSALQIAHDAQLRPISEVAASAGILPEELEQSGQYRGKVRLVLPGQEDRDRGGQYRPALGQVAAQLGQRAAGGARELVRAGLRGRAAGVVVAVASPAAGCDQRAGEQQGGKYSSGAHGRRRLEDARDSHRRRCPP